MKKLFTLVVSALMAGSVFAQDVPYIFSKVADNTYAVTMTQEEIEQKYESAWINDAFNMGVVFPAGTVMFENDDLVISAAVDGTIVYTTTSLAQIRQAMEENPGYTGCVNLGSSFSSRGIDITKDLIDNVSDKQSSKQGILLVSPKTKGTLSYGVYAGENKRWIGIYQMPTDAEKKVGSKGKWLDYNLFQNDGSNGTVANAPAYSKAEVDAEHSYVLIPGGKSLNLHQIKFAPAVPSHISSTLKDGKGKTVEGYYTVGGVRLNNLQKGSNIVKYSDGTVVKVIK